MKRGASEDNATLWREEGTDTDRLAFFSDAVFAIAMTLLVIDLRPPDLAPNPSPGALFEALVAEWPSYLSYAVSFWVIGTLWRSHHRSFRWLAGWDAGLVTLNLLLLMAVAFVPFPTAVLGRYGTNPTAVTFYAATHTVVALLWRALWDHAHRAGLLQPGVDPRWVAYLRARMLGTAAVFASSIPVAWLAPRIPPLWWLLLFLVHPVVDRIYPIPAADNRR